MWRVYAAGVLIVLTLMAVALGYFHWSQEKMAGLQSDIAGLGVAVAEQNQTIDGLNNHIVSVQDAYMDYNTNVNRHRNDSAQLAQTITRPEIHNNASTQPRETEVIINNFTDNLFNQFELISRGHTEPVPSQ